ncbi:unnamed protein product [Microthlaspi erraticum]|uniref:Uncharacterized protein n=1 Tax=Microthlaspi erraticum TaxID=1685480 RepID=A0A6D2IZL5_9BRAS|nr:unnamed protein product [Microthlaspi erraticum]
MPTEYFTAEELERYATEYWREVEESDGFDFSNGMMGGLMRYHCDCRYPYRILVDLYAKAGLHRYNMLKGTSFQLAEMVKFNMTPNHVCSFYITLLAHEAADNTSQKTFQVRVDEEKFSQLNMTCSIARLKGEVTTHKPWMPHFHCGAKADGIFKGEIPDWPLDDDAFNDGKRFYVVEKSEWEANDWISMYLELVVCANDRSLTSTIQRTDVMSKLEIVKVAIETGIEDVEPPNERLKAKSAHVYIIFKGLAEARALRRVFEIGEHVERKAIVRRVIDDKGYLTLTGKLCGGQSTDTRTCKKRPRNSYGL